MKTEKLGVGKVIIACVAFWVFTFFGSSIAMIWNSVSMFISGYGYKEGSFGYLVLQIISTAFGAGLAIAAIKSITKGLADIMCIVNLSIAATLFFIIGTVGWIQGINNWENIVGLYLAFTVYVIGIIVFAQEHKEKIEEMSHFNENHSDSLNADFISVEKM